MVVFNSDAMFRYKGFKCRYRAIQPNGIAVINSFGDEDDGTNSVGKKGYFQFLRVQIIEFGKTPIHQNRIITVGSDVVYSANFFTGQVGQCLEQSISIDALEPNGEGGDDQNHVGANLFGGLWSGICGTANTVGSSGSTTEGQRIVGGFETMEHQYPWMVSSLLQL